MRFSKLIVLICIVSIIVYTGAALFAFIHVGAEPEALTYSVYGFFGTELCMLVVTKIFGERDVGKPEIRKKSNKQPKG